MTNGQPSTEELEELKRKATEFDRISERREHEDELVKAIQKRFSLGIVVTAVASFIGIQGIAYLIIDQNWGRRLQEKVDKAADAVAGANAATENAKSASTKARSGPTESKPRAAPTTGSTVKLPSAIRSRLMGSSHLSEPASAVTTS